VDPQSLAGIDRFAVTQRITLGVNRYEIRSLGPTGRPGELLAFAQQKRLAFREQVTFWTGADRRTPVFSFRARQRLDVGATYDVVDADGRRLGEFRKDFAASLLRSTWHLTSGGVTAVGRERDARVALLRRGWEMLPFLGTFPSPFLFHFDFVDTRTGVVVMTSERQRALRDRYVVTVPGGVLDGRVAAAMAVALDTLQSR
jgi:hypothetical protein